ncbi:hypothetical protein LTR85_004524 [Meristemomyces frigidus]|nr:hypothetical protein LTR85_004524 [Meristemomyces frigidus]
MQPLTLVLGLLLAFASAVPAARNTKPAANAVLLSQVKSLTLRDGQQTSGRRVSPMPQLTCIGGSGKSLYNVDVMRCKNAGAEYDAEDVQWTCQAALPLEFKLGATEVVCEGYDSPDDPYILKGSCGVEYRLVLTDVGEEKYGKNSFERAYRNPSGQSVGSALFTFLFWAIFISVIGIILYKILFANTANNNDRRGPGNGYGIGWNGGGRGGGDDGDDDPPPPYTPSNPKPSSSHRANRAAPNYSAGSTHGQQADGTWRPGFWTGTAAGAAAGYAASALGGRNATRNAAADRARQTYDQPQAGPSNWFGRTRDPSPPRASPFGGGSSYFGGGGGGGGSSRPSASSQPSSSRYESTGFGGTRRR